MCNKKLDQENIDIEKLTNPSGPVVPIPSCTDGSGIYLEKAISILNTGYFEHKAYNTFVGDPSDFINDPAGPLSGCYEIHKVKKGAPLRVTGRCRMTFSVNGALSPDALQNLHDLYDQAMNLGDTEEAKNILQNIVNANSFGPGAGSMLNPVPKQFREHYPSLFGCILGCRTWTIIADKVEYYYPTYLVTLSQDPLYSRYLDRDTAKKMFSKYQSAVENEIQNQEMSNKTSKRVLESITEKKKEGKTNKSERAIQPSKGVPETRFLSQSKHGYMRIFPIKLAEDAY